MKITNSIDYKYHEDKALSMLQEYVDGTYGQHYVGDGDVQTVDFWRSLGSLETTSRDTAIKYLARYGKKGGKNRKDIMKAMHYCVLMLYALDLEEAELDVVRSVSGKWGASAALDEHSEHYYDKDRNR
jgi:hypothetical protein|tara:strand:- start:1323 stop:1706 length:384 start_codon:yes stop_codon:yes gene_type:complete